MLFVTPPPADRTGVNRLPDLPMADRCDGSLGPVKIEAGRFPVEPEELDQPPALAFEIADQPLVIDLDHMQRPQRQPMPRQTLDLAAAMAAIGQVVGEILRAVAEQLRIAGQRDVAWVAAAIDDPRPWKQQPDQP